MKRKSLIVSTLFLALVLGGTVLSVNQTTGADVQTLTAARVSKAPATLDDPAWQKAKAVDVPFVGKEKFAGKKANVIPKPFTPTMKFLSLQVEGRGQKRDQRGVAV